MSLEAVVLALSLTAQAAPAPSPEVRDQVRALLGNIDTRVPPETFRALGPGAEEALADFAREEQGSPLRRVHALEALAGLGGARAEAVHREVLARSTAPRAVRRAAVRGLGRLAGPRRAAAELSPVLEQDSDPVVRATAAEALAAHAPADACARIRARALVEPAPSRFHRALTTCDRASRAGSRRR
ncbi:MAG TPA: HEAT repeat domain-containing protein [Anaeromyxobacter sp.]